MKICPRLLLPCRAGDRRRFALHPLSFAVCLAMSNAALALPQGGTVVNGSATITRPTSTSELIKQTTDKAIIDWKSFSIAAGEKVRFAQPSDTSITLNRVTGYDPSYILGQMSSNGKIFLVNPYGVVFGAGARVDVGGLVVSSLSIADNDFLAGRYRLTSIDPGGPAQRGEVRNEGLISAPGGTVVLAGPSVTNTGTIVANGGRVGLVAANSVSVDVEGDGLIFFDADATEAKNRLAQLGRIQADGGTVEMRAEARGAFADTVLNMAGIVQAKSIGTHQGQVVIDGGGDGVTAVSGLIDASGAVGGQRGGDVTVLGQRILLASAARIDASGDAGGGAIRIGGDFHGADPALHDAEAVVVAAGAQLRADAGAKGDGGTVAVWSDGATKYQGSISAVGGNSGGNGGYVEVSGKQSLVYDGNVDTRAARGSTGTLLLDPTDITIDSVPAQSSTLDNAGGVFSDPTTPSNIKPATLVAQLASSNVVVDTGSAAAGAGTITVKSPISWGTDFSLTLKATTDITINPASAITNSGKGGLNLFADGNITLNSAVSLAGGDFKVAGTAGGASPAASFTSAGAGTITTTGPDGSFAVGTPGGNVTIATTGNIVVGNIAARGGSGPAEFGAGNAGNVNLGSISGAISTGSIDASGGAGSGVTGGATGGKGGDITLSASAGSAQALNAGVITAVGGKGSDNLGANGAGGTGGAGGIVSITNSSGGATTLQSIDTTGGAAGVAGSGVSDGGNGGAAGTITVVAGATLAVADLTALGGAATAGSAGGNAGIAGAGQAIALNFGQTSAGTLDLRNATSIVGASATATGGAGTDTVIVTGGAGENISLTPTLLTRPSAGNVALNSVEAASIVTGTGTTDLSGWTGGRSANVQLTVGAGAITGNGLGTTLHGLGAGSTFTVNAANGGTADTTTFSAIGNLAGGPGADTFTLTGAGTLAGSVDGGAGTNTLALSTPGTANFGLTSATTGTASGVGGGYSNIGALIGNGTSSVLAGTNAASTYSVTGSNAGSINDGSGTTSFSGMAKLVGGSAADSFVIAAGAAIGSIDGGGGNNSLSAVAGSAEDITLSDTQLARSVVGNTTLSNIAAASLTGGSGGNTLDGSAWSGPLALQLGAGADVLKGNGSKTTLVAAAGGSTIDVTGADSGTAGTTAFTQIGTLSGGAGADTFTLAGTGSLSGSIDGGAGSNTLDLSGRAAAGSANFAMTSAGSGTASGVSGGFSNVATLVGNNTNSTLAGSNAASTFSINAGNAGTVNDGIGTTNFSGIASLVGGTAADRFAVANAGSLSGSVDGGSGANTLDLSARATADFALTSASAGNASGVAGGYSNVTSLVGNGTSSVLAGSNAASSYSITGVDAGTVNATTTFSGIASLTGGSSADTFAIVNAGSLNGSIDGGAGANTLDLSGKTGAANFGLTSASAGTASGLAGSYSNISTLVGNGSSSTLTGTNAASSYAVSGAGSGAVGSTAFSGIASLLGGTAADTFVIQAGGTLSGSIGGGGGTNMLDLSGRGTANFTLTSASTGSASGLGGGYSNVTTLIGNGSTSTLTGSNTASTFNVAAANTGTVNAATSFSGIANLAGGSGADTFVVLGAGTLSGNIDGGAGANALDLSALATANFSLTSASAGNASGIAGAYGNVTTLIGNGSNSTLTGTTAASTFSITGNNAGTLSDGSGSASFSGMPRLIGGAAADSFVIGAGFAIGSIDGGSGSNSLNATAGAAENITLADTQLTRSLAGSTALANIGSAALAGGSGNNVINASAWTGARTVTIQATAGADSITGNGIGSTLLAAPGGSTISVTGADAGTAGSTTFSQIGNLTGGAGVETFAIANAGSLSGGIAGMGGNDTLNLSAKAGAVTISQSGATTGSGVSGAITGISNVVGNGANTTFIGNNAAQTYTVTGVNTVSVAGTTLNGVGNLTGGSAADIFVVQAAGSLSGSIDGGGGANTLDLSSRPGAGTANFALSGSTAGSAGGVSGGYSNVGTLIGNNSNSVLAGSSAASTFSVTANNAGTINNGIGTTSFSGIASLAGGAAADVFAIANGGALTGSIDGGAGSNTLDLSARGTGNFAMTSASGGTASGLTGGYTNIAALVGNGSTSTLTGSNAASSYVVSAADAGSVNGTTSFSGIANLLGGTAADNFALASGATLSGSIDGGGGINTLDLSGRGTANFALTSASAGTASGVTGGYANVGVLVGNGSSSTLSGTNAASTFILTAANTGTVNAATSFSGMANLAGGASADNFVVQAAGSLSGSLDGGAGANTLDLSGRGAANFGLASASAGTASGIGGGYGNVAVLIGNGTSSTLTGTNTASTFAVTANNAGTVNDGIGTTAFSGVPKLVGGSAGDGFVIGTGFAIGSIDGGGGANAISVTAGNSENVTLADAQLSRSVAGNTTLANLASATLVGGSGNNIIDAAAWSSPRTVAIQASPGADSITGNGSGTTVIGTAAASIFNLTGPDSGTLGDGVNVTTFTAVGNLTGGAGNDTFLIQNPGTLSGSLDGGGGLNTLDLSNKSSATIVFHTGSNSVSGVGIAGTLSHIGALIGNVANTSLQGNDAGQSFAITANNEITVDASQVFKGVANLDAGSGADSISGTSFKLAGHISDAGGVTSLSGTIRTDGSQTYAGPVLAPAVSLVALGGISAVNPGNDFGSVALSGGAIDVHDANAIDLTSITVGAGQPLAITAAGTITLHGNVSTTADQTYNGNLSLAANSTLDAGAGRVAILGNVDGGSHDLTLASSANAGSAITLDGSVGNVGAFSANGNTTLGGNVSSSGPQTFAGSLALTGNTTLDAGAGKLDLRGTVDGGGHSLVASSSNAAADAIHVGGTIGNVTQFDANGRSTLAANVVTTGNQTYAGVVTLAADTTLDAGAGTIALQSGLDGGGGVHSVTLASTAAGSNAIAIGGGVGNVAAFNANGNATLAGNISSAGTQTFSGSLTLTGNSTLDAGAGKVDLHGAIDGGGNSFAASSSNAAADAIHVGGVITNVAQFNASGRSTLGADITTTGGQAYSGAVTLAADSGLSGGSVSFASTVDGAFHLDVKANTTSFVGAVGSAVALSSLTTDAAGSTQIGNSVRTTGNQTYNDNLVLTGDSAMTASGLAFNGTVDGTHALTLTSASPVSFAQAIGAITPLATLSVIGPLALNAPRVMTTGAQTFSGAVTLGTSTTLSGSTMDFGSTVDGGFGLTLNGASSFGGAVGAGTALDSLTANGAVRINGNGMLRSAAIALNGPLSGAADLSLLTDTLTGGNSMSGTGKLTIQPIDAALPIGIAGGSGGLLIAQSVLSGAAGFTSHVIGNVNGSGAISVGNLTLAADTTLQTGTGDINLGGSVDGAHALVLNSGGTTRIAGPVGVTTPLTSLTTDNSLTAPDWNGTSGERTTFDSADGSGSARIVTTGAQTYNDPLTASVPISFRGGAITAVQPSNSFSKTVSALADTLQLQATGDLTLGTITLANGGSIETGNVLHLSGALQLDGGTLLVTSDATLSAGAFNDSTLPATPRYGGVTLNEASAAIVQDSGTIKSAVGSLLVLRAPNGGSILLDQLDSGNLPVNQLLGSVSAVSGRLGDDGSRFNGGATTIDLGFIRIASSEIHVAGKPAGGDQTALQAGLEGDVIKLTADVLTTGTDGLIRARLPFNSLQGSTSSIPALTFVLTPTALAGATPPNATSYGTPSPSDFLQIQIGSADAGGFITARPLGLPGSGAGKVIFLGGGAEARPFYDGNGKLTEIRIFYNGDAPRTPQEAGALAAVIAIIEEARHARFEEAVRTENVSSRLRSGVIAEVGAGRPATVGRESIKLPESCDVKPGTLRCE